MCLIFFISLFIYYRYNIQENVWEQLPRRTAPQVADCLFVLNDEQLFVFSHLGPQHFDTVTKTWSQYPAAEFEDCPWGNYGIVQLSRRS